MNKVQLQAEMDPTFHFGGGAGVREARWLNLTPLLPRITSYYTVAIRGGYLCTRPCRQGQWRLQGGLKTLPKFTSAYSQRLSVVKTLQKLHSSRERSPFVSYYTSSGRIFVRLHNSARATEIPVNSTKEDIVAIYNHHMRGVAHEETIPKRVIPESVTPLAASAQLTGNPSAARRAEWGAPALVGSGLWSGICGLVVSLTSLPPLLLLVDTSPWPLFLRSVMQWSWVMLHSPHPVAALAGLRRWRLRLCCLRLGLPWWCHLMMNWMVGDLVGVGVPPAVRMGSPGWGVQLRGDLPDLLIPARSLGPLLHLTQVTPGGSLPCRPYTLRHLALYLTWTRLLLYLGQVHHLR